MITLKSLGPKAGEARSQYAERRETTFEVDPQSETGSRFWNDATTQPGQDPRENRAQARHHAGILCQTEA